MKVRRDHTHASRTPTYSPCHGSRGGYRDVPDGLAPGKDGLSNLLFDGDGKLVTHADFHAANPTESGGEPHASPADRDEATEFLVRLGVALAVAGGTWGARRITRAIKERRERHARGAETLVEMESEAADEADTATAQLDEQDALIAEVHSLVSDASSTRSESIAQCETESDDEPSKPVKERRLRNRGR